MPAGASNAAADMVNVSNRRQPVRQTRNQPPKYAFSRGSLGRASTGGVADERNQTPAEPGFYPALTHFTDSITALPKEMLRHFGMFKEVDSKIYGPEENLKRLLADVLHTPQPPPFADASRAFEARSRAQSTVPSTTGSVANGVGGAAVVHGASQASLTSQVTALESYDMPRRQNFFNLRYLVTEMLPVLEEKNHVISSATDELSRQLARCESSWPELEKEFSEETRWGNLAHWAYSDRSSEKKDTRVERPRREAAVHHNFASVQDDFGAVRGTGKRRAQQAQIENEIEETRANKRALGAGRAKKSTANQANAVGLGLSTGTHAPAPKKRKTEEVPVPSAPIERSLSTVFGKASTSKGNASPRSRSPAGTKRARTAATAAGATNGKGRARAGTGASAANSPLVVSSPVVGNFGGTKPNASPAIGAAMQRQSSSRARQNSLQGSSAPTSNPKPSTNTTNHNNMNSSSDAPIAQPPKASARTPKIEAAHEESEVRSTAVKREDSATNRHRPPNIATGTRASGKASKNATPVHASFADAGGTSRPRSNRANQATEASNSKNGGGTSAGSPALPSAPKRSHKKGASISAIHQREEAAAKAAAATSNSHATSGGQDGRYDGADDDDDGNGERYCYCGGPSYGDMVGCDGDGCPREWFHLDCIGLSKVPAGKAKWYCDECKKRLKIG